MIGVMGAGAIGCWVGGKLLAAGQDVIFVGRERIKSELETHGLVLGDLAGPEVRIAKEQLRVETSPRALGGCDVILCSVKSGQTAEVAAEMPAGAMVVSLQNGLRAAETLRASLGDRALAAVVGFNVIGKGDGEFRRTTTGPLVIEAHPRVEGVVRALRSVGVESELAEDIRAVQWAKLVMNLNNAVSALSGAPTPALLFVPGYRRVLRALMAEAISVMRAAGIRPARLGPIPVTLFPHVLALPTPILRAVASAQLKIDPEARSSMYEDLSRRRLTEVDDLNGEIVRLAEKTGVPAPLHRRVVELVHEVERKGEGSPNLSPEALSRALHS
ncbi:MAG: 2-dehydropantoate 2-reductase [Polyangiales bacterium]